MTALSRSSFFAPVLAAALVVAAAPAASAAPAPVPTPKPPAIAARTSSSVSAAPLPTVQIDAGVVWTQTMIGSTVYAGGSFSNARPAGAAKGKSLVPRSNLLAYDIRTGNLLTGFAPKINGEVKVVRPSPDGKVVYIGGSFSSVNGKDRYRVAALNATNGTLIADFAPAVGGSYVNAIAVHGSTVYLGGLFTAVAGVDRTNLAAVSTGGALLGWNPITDRQVDAMVFTPKRDKLIIGGRFTTVNGTSQRGMAAIDPQQGHKLAWAVANQVKNGIDGRAGISSLATDGSRVFGAGWSYAAATGGNLEGVFAANPDTGALVWLEDCHGDSYDVFSDGVQVYTAGHAHDCASLGGFPDTEPRTHHQTLSFTTAAKGVLLRSPTTSSTYQSWEGTRSPALINWFPDWTVGTATGQGQAAWSVVGNGEYLSVGGEFPAVNNNPQYGLVRFGRSAGGTAARTQGPRVATAAWAPVAASAPAGARVSIPANWDRDDRDLTYRLNRSGGGAPVAVRQTSAEFWNRPAVVLSDPTAPKGTATYTVDAIDSVGNTVTSKAVKVSVGGAAATISPYVRRVLADGADVYWRLGGGAAAGTDWAGTNNGTVGSGVTAASEGAVGGDKNVGSRFAGTSAATIAATAATTVRPAFSLETWIRSTSTTGGKLIGLGNSRSGLSTVTDRNLYLRNNGTIGFATNPGAVQSVVTPKAYNDGKWHHVVATLSGAGSVLYVDGAKVAANSAQTSASSLSGYWRVGGDTLTGWPVAPKSAYYTGVLDETAIYGVALTAAQVAAHYQLRTGSLGAAPKPAFTTSVAGKKVSVDARGTVFGTGTTGYSYAWNFGDGSTATGRTAVHTYARADNYPVKLTVMDSAGRSASLTQSVSVVGSAIGSDDFTRTVATGWGTAPTGGVWTASGAAKVNGSEGVLMPKTGTGAAASLKTLSAREIDAAVTFALPKRPASGKASTALIVRQVSGGSYRVVVHVQPDGTAKADLIVKADKVDKTLATMPISNYAAGTKLRLRLQAVTNGTSTDVRARIWKTAGAEPTYWSLSATDAAKPVQATGGVGVSTALSGAAAGATQEVRFDGLRIYVP